MLNNTSTIIKGITNGFKVYSPDGATWSSAVGGTMPDHNFNSYFPLVFSINHFSCDGYGADTVGFGGATISTGLPIGFDDTAYTVTIGPIDNSHADKMICLDSSYYPPSGSWKWTAGGGSDFYPTWTGPFCYTIGEPPITFRGYLSYLDPTPKPYGPDTTEEPMRHIRIEMWDEDQIPLQHQRLASTRANSTGRFEFNDISNIDQYGTGGQDVYFVVEANNGFVEVIQDTAFNVHQWRTAVWNDVPGGTYDTAFVSPTDSSGPFFVAYVILDALNTWDTLRPPGLYPVGFGRALLAADTMGSLYDSDNDLIFINDSIDADNRWPDTWSRSTIMHEFGHRISHKWEFCDDDTNYPDSHYAWVAYNQETAALEGFAHWWACIVRNNPIRRNFFNNHHDSLWHNLENGLFGHQDSLFYGVNAMGIKNEGAVAGILWDIYDSIHDDWSTVADFFNPYDTTDSLNDGHADSLSDGPECILVALLDCHPDDIIEFWDGWFTEPELGFELEMTNIFYEHGDSTRPCCIGIRGNVDGDPNDVIDIVDLLYLTDYMFDGGPAPSCFEEANIDACEGIDIADLVVLVDYMFSGGEAPWPCP